MVFYPNRRITRMFRIVYINSISRCRKRTILCLVLLILLTFTIISFIIARKGFTFPWLNPLMSGSIYAIKGVDQLRLKYTSSYCSYTNTILSPPKFVHQSWKTNIIPARFVKYSESWKNCFPNWRYLLWTDQNNRDFIQKHYPWFLPRYDSYPLNIHRADAVRYFYMFHYGGIYSDLDNECLRQFDVLLNNASLIFGAMESSQSYSNIPEGLVQNSFMFSRPHHPFWLEVIWEMCQHNWGYPERMTGPKVLEIVISKFRKQCGSQSVTIYPPKYFNPFSWASFRGETCKTHRQMSGEDSIKCKHLFNQSYVIQYHAHTWSA